MPLDHPALHSPLSRRRFLVSASSLAGGLSIAVMAPRAAAAAQDSAEPWDRPADHAQEVGIWLVIAPDDRITLRVAKSEMGQGVLTSLAMLLAEELGCDWTKVTSEYASAHRVVSEHAAYGPMITGGSTSVSTSRIMLQQAGASARARLIQAAAAAWHVDASDCTVATGLVRHAKSGRTVTFGVIAAAASAVTLDREPDIKLPDQYTLVGQPTPRLDTKVKVNGSANFGIDMRLPGMLYAAVIQCPVPGGTLGSVDGKTALAKRGIKKVVPLPGAVAIVADNFWRAKEAIADLKINWLSGAGAGTSSQQFRDDYRAALDQPNSTALDEGAVDAAFGRGRLVNAVYEVPHVAHATMEPLNCTAHVQADRVDIWMGTQAPDLTLRLAAQLSGVPPERVFVHNCFLGGGFGRRAANDEMAHAVLVSKAMGAPVKLIWTREEDMRHDRYRPQAALRFRASLGDDGQPTAIEARTVVGSIVRSLGWHFPGFEVKDGVEPMAVEGLINMPYDIPAKRVLCLLKNTHIPVMFWRSVGSSQNAFAIESFIDEMAHEAGVDPLAFRRKLLSKRPDFLHVLDVLAARGDWGKPMPAGSGRGLAIHECFGTIVGEVAEVSVSPKGEVKVHRVVAAVDCGHVVNPRTVEMQIESAVIYGLQAAMHGEITVKDGAIEQGNFDEYEMVRLADAPAIETYMALSGGEKWGGIGEPGTPPIAPAVCNAIFQATGKRVRSLPIKNMDLSHSA